MYQGENALLEQAEEAGNMSLGSMVIDRLSQYLHPDTNISCGWFFTSIQVV